MLRRVAVLALVSGLTSVVQASDLNVSVQCGASNMMTTGPGCTVQYAVVGVLSDMANEGLALVGFDLQLVQPNGGPNPPQAANLPQANAPTAPPMTAFNRNEGITNPAGFGGTLVSGKLLQCGGGQNTIMNGQVPCVTNGDCPAGSTCQVGGLCSPVAPYPVGTVITGVAKGSPQVLLTGTFTAPNTPGTYELRLTSLFANVIRQGEDGNPFWATDQANAGTIANLTVEVQNGASCAFCGCKVVGSNPPKNSIDARQPHNLSAATPAQGISVVDLTFDCAPLAAEVEQGDFTVTSTAGSPPSFTVSPLAGNIVTVNFSAPIERQAWTRILHVPSNTATCIGYLPGDVNQSRTTNVSDITGLINCLNGVGVCQLYQTDINRSGSTTATDITRLIDLLNGASAFDPWQNLNIPVSPCP